MAAPRAINGLQQNEQSQASIPSITLNADSPKLKLPPLSSAEIARALIFLRILQNLPSRRLKKQERAETNLSSPHSKDDYQLLWRTEINDHLVNHPKSQLRKLFKRQRETAGEGSSTPSKLRPPPPSSRVDQIQLLRRLRDSLPDQDGGSDNANATDQDWEADKVKLEHLFLQPRVWKSWQYQCAYPRLASFLHNANHEFRSRCEVNVRDFPYDEEENSLDEWNSVIDQDVNALKTKVQRAASDHRRPRLRLRRQTVLNHEKLWEHIRSRFKAKGRQNYVLGRSDSSYIVPCRVLQIVDLSPNAACLLLESSARVDLSYVAMFMERHLTNMNWATVNLVTNTGPNSKLRNYLFEYHISFYHVTSGHTNHDDGYGDARNARRVSPFTAGPKAKARRIYEEQLSFITIGHGGDVYTNIQLAEKYSCDPNDDLYESPFYVQSANKREDGDLNRFEEENRGIAFFVSRLKPSSAFLAWIANSMRHVVARWQTAILAVDRETDSNFQATFHGDKHSLLADDSSFSRSKRYVWAIQVYGIFQKKLDETISVWKNYEESSLERLDQDQITHKEESLIIIKAAISALELKRDHVRERRREVSDMKDALFATSQLLDSRNTVTQNENIRLLTYVNLLFLPLAFCTSIFGMQTILPTHVHGVYFAVTICIVTVFTIFMVFNLPHMIEIAEGIMGKVTKLLRKLMDAHHRRHWHKTAQALQTSREAKNIIVQNRLRRNSTWMYLVFLLEIFFVMIPVHEIKAARRGWGLRERLNKDKRAPPTAGQGLTGIPDRTEQEEKDTSVAHSLVVMILSVVRALFLPLSIILVGLEVAVISIYILTLYAIDTCYETLRFRTRDDDSMTTTASEKRKQKPHPFRIPLQLLGFYVKDEVRLPANIQRKVKRWRGIIAESQGETVLHAVATSASTEEDGSSPYFVSRSEAAKEEELQARRPPSPGPSPPASPTRGLRVTFERGLRRMSEGSVVRLAERGASPSSSPSSRPSPGRARTLSPGRFPQT